MLTDSDNQLISRYGVDLLIPRCNVRHTRWHGAQSM